MKPVVNYTLDERNSLIARGTRSIMQGLKEFFDSRGLSHTEVYIVVGVLDRRPDGVMTNLAAYRDGCPACASKYLSQVLIDNVSEQLIDMTKAGHEGDHFTSAMDG